MRKILLVCSAGMSTSMLVKRVQDAAKIQNYEIEIDAFSISQARTIGHKWDVILLGPQVRYLLKEMKASFPNKPVEAIEMRTYGRMDGEAVLRLAKTLLGD